MDVRDPSKWLQVLLWAGLAIGCDPYDDWKGDFHAGPVDPIHFDPTYLGTGGDRFRTGSGSFTAARAFVDGAPDEYFAFPFSDAQLGTTHGDNAEPLLATLDGEPASGAPLPLAYVFDPSAESPFPPEARCQKPENYSYELARDGIRYDEQGNIFTSLPEATYSPGVQAVTSYVPVVRQVPVSSNGVKCQEPKSEKSVVTRGDVNLEKQTLPGNEVIGVSDGRFLAWAIIDPGAAVFHAEVDAPALPTPETAGIGIQRWGWFNHYLLAYLDGGYIPTAETVAEDVREVRFVAQKLYVPRSQIVTGTDPVSGEPSLADVAIGEGYDVLQFARTQPGYSPVCEVVTYELPAPTAPADLPKSAAAIEAAYSTTFEPGSPQYIYCLQTE